MKTRHRTFVYKLKRGLRASLGGSYFQDTPETPGRVIGLRPVMVYEHLSITVISK